MASLSLIAIRLFEDLLLERKDYIEKCRMILKCGFYPMREGVLDERKPIRKVETIWRSNNGQHEEGVL